MDQPIKVKFIKDPRLVRRSGIDLDEANLKPEILAALRCKFDAEQKISNLLLSEKRLIERESVYRKLNKLELRSLGIERGIKFANTATTGTLIYGLLDQDNEQEVKKKGGLTELRTFPLKLHVYDFKQTLKNLEMTMSAEELKKTVKSRVKAGKTVGTEKLFDEIVAKFPNILNKLNDPRYSLARTKKIENVGYHIFYATQRETGEIFFRWLKHGDQGKFLGDHVGCVKRFDEWAVEAKLADYEKAILDGIEAVKKEKADKAAKKAAKEQEAIEAAKVAGEKAAAAVKNAPPPPMPGEQSIDPRKVAEEARKKGLKK